MRRFISSDGCFASSARIKKSASIARSANLAEAAKLHRRAQWRVDFVNAKVTVLEIPRDLWVKIPDIADNLNGQDHEKLNQAYLYGNPGFGYTDDPARGPGLLTRTLTLNFGTQIDHYAAVNMRTFEKIVNAERFERP